MARTYRSVVVALLAAVSLLSACGRSKPAPSQDDKEGATPAVTTPTVQLTPEQLQSLHIEAVGERPFTIQFGAVGSVTFEEDPAIVQAEATLLTAQAAQDAAHRELTRVQALGENNGIAPKELESARAADLAAAAAARAAGDAVRALGVPEHELRALAHAGVFPAAGASPGHAWVLVDVPESDSARIHTGERVRFSVPAYPNDTFEGRVFRVYSTLDPASHRLAARAEVIDPDRKLRAGMLADVQIEYGGPVRSPAVPTTTAVREPDGRMVAWVTTDRTHFSSRDLTLGLQEGGQYQVLSGLKPGDLVVTEGGVFLSNLLEAPPSD